MNSRLVVVIVLLAAVSLSAGSLTLCAQTQTTGALAGTITDPSGAVVPGATVSLQDLAKGTTQSTTTSSTGTYRFDLLAPGSYAVTVKATGFQVLSQKATIYLGQVTTVDIQLVLGPQAQTVTVTVEAVPLVNTENANVASMITQTQTQNIPNPGNDLTYIAQVAPGSTMNTGGGGYGNFASYGISAVSNLFTLDGMDSNDPFLNLNDSGATNQMLGQNEIQEVSVVANGYTGEYGGLAGTNINYITKSGTNDFHGRATWYWNGRTMNANTWFNKASDTPRSFVNANQYGADVGGPIVKNKLFFYSNVEGLYLVIPTSVPAFVPSPAFESAVLSNIASLEDPTQLAFYKTAFALWSTAPGVSRAKDTLPDHGCDGSEFFFNTAGEGYTFGTYNKVSNPLGAGTPCALGFRSTAGNLTHDNLQVGRVDWNMTNNDRAFLRVQHELGVQATFTDPINALFNDTSIQPEWQGQLNETHTFGSGAVNQFIAAAQWYGAIFTVSGGAKALATFPTDLVFYSSLITTNSGPLTSVGGGIGFYFPEGRNVTQFQLSDDFTKVFGAHTLKVGIKYRRNWITNADYGIEENGIEVPITLDAFFWGGADPNLTAALDGNYAIGIQSFPSFPEARFSVYNLGGYVEDDWKLSPKLTLTLAFRLDHAENPVCFTSCFVHSIGINQLAASNADTPYASLLATGQHNLLPSLTELEPQPRIGLAWQVTHNTVVRGGAGIFFDNYPGVALDAISENGPNEPTFTVSSFVPTSTTTGIYNETVISSPSDPTSVLTQAATANSAFRTGFATGGSFNTVLETDPSFSAPNLTLTQANPKVMQYQKWNLDVQHQFGSNTFFDLGYVGNHGIHILMQNNGINGCNFTGAFASLPACNTTSFTGVNPNFLTVTYDQSIGIANYNGMTASFTHRYKSGLVQLNYTWSHALDDVSDSGILPFSSTGFGATNTSLLYPEDPFKPKKYNYGSADYDARHTLNLNYVWELPIKRFITFGHGPGRLVDGWMVNGAMFLRSGFPITPVDITTSGELSSGGYGATVFGTQVTAGGSGANCRALYGSGEPNVNDCFNTANFTTSPDGFGNIIRNSFRGPGYWGTDFALMKHTKITERVEFAFGAQFFNVFNHPNFDAPLMDTSNAKFGEILRTVSPPTTMYGSVLGADASPRLVQLKTQLIF